MAIPILISHSLNWFNDMRCRGLDIWGSEENYSVHAYLNGQLHIHFCPSSMYLNGTALRQ